LGLATSSTPLAAQEPGPEAAPGLPLWEIALGATGLYGPDYPASDEYHPNGLAAPLFIYRGAILQLGERDIARVVAVDRGRFRLDFSLDASYRAGSDDNDARAGMPDLDYLGEVGPQLVVEMSELTMRQNRPARLELELPTRAVFATDLRSIEHLGFIFAPGLVLDEEPDGAPADRLRAQLSVNFASGGVMGYLYEVAPRFAVPVVPPSTPMPGTSGAAPRSPTRRRSTGASGCTSPANSPCTPGPRTGTVRCSATTWARPSASAWSGRSGPARVRCRRSDTLPAHPAARRTRSRARDGNQSPSPPASPALALLIRWGPRHGGHLRLGLVSASGPRPWSGRSLPRSSPRPRR
jgi:hypothetical protein